MVMILEDELRSLVENVVLKGGYKARKEVFPEFSNEPFSSVKDKIIDKILNASTDDAVKILVKFIKELTKSHVWNLTKRFEIPGRSEVYKSKDPGVREKWDKKVAIAIATKGKEWSTEKEKKETEREEKKKKEERDEIRKEIEERKKKKKEEMEKKLKIEEAIDKAKVEKVNVIELVEGISHSLYNAGLVRKPKKIKLTDVVSVLIPYSITIRNGKIVTIVHVNSGLLKDKIKIVEKETTTTQDVPYKIIKVKLPYPEDVKDVIPLVEKALKPIGLKNLEIKFNNAAASARSKDYAMYYKVTFDAGKLKK